MIQNISKMELLAPAGDWDALKAGVAGGADAFYLGGKMFSARQSAANFDLDDLKKVADYLHLRGRKMYVTVNTLIKENELETALEFIEKLYLIGTDAVIIQDIGLLYLVRKIWPDFEVHASTQMTIMDAAGVRFLQKLGVKRAVLAREVSINEMAEIYSETGMDLEVFVHGALCVSYSGACLFSSLIGGRSGNRGRCAQPCRMEYKLTRARARYGCAGINEVKTEGPHLLSPKDLSLLPYLPELAASGVKSLKIEGRMKGPEYVGTVVRVYKNALERLESDPSEFKPTSEETKALQMVFNRGFSTGYSYEDLGPELMSVTRPSNRGRFLGRVKFYDYKKRRVTVSLDANLAEGDGIEVWVTKGGRLGTIVEDLKLKGEKVKKANPGSEVVFALPNPAQPGDRVFLTSSKNIEDNTRQMLRNDYFQSRLSCKMKAEVAPNKPLVVSCWDNEGNSVIVHSDDLASIARKRPLTEEVLKKHLTRLGDSPFIVEEFQADISGEPMLPYGKIHQVRREVVEALSTKKLKIHSQLRNSSYKMLLKEVSAETKKRRKGTRRTGKSFFTVYAGDMDTIESALSYGIDRILIGGERYHPKFSWNQDTLSQAVKACRAAGAEIIIALPEITRQKEREYLSNYLNNIKALSPNAIMVTFPGSLQRVLEETNIPVYLNSSFPSLNSYGVTFLESKRLKGFTISSELSQQEIKSFFHQIPFLDLEIELIVFGTTELMVSQFCPIGAWEGGSSPKNCTNKCQDAEFFLRDRKGIDFPIITDEFCRMRLLNSRDLCLVKEVPDLKERNLRLRLDLRYYSSDISGQIIRIYQETLEEEMEIKRAQSWEAIEKITGRKLTRGHYYRGVE